jgi:hypothetical protein
MQLDNKLQRSKFKLLGTTISEKFIDAAIGSGVVFWLHPRMDRCSENAIISAAVRAGRAISEDGASAGPSVSASIACVVITDQLIRYCLIMQSLQGPTYLPTYQRQ